MKFVWLAIGMLTPLSLALAQERPALIAVDPVRRVEITESVPVLGNITARTRSQIASWAAGFVGRTPVSAGDVVIEGDRLIELDPQPFIIAREAANAVLLGAAQALEAALLRLNLASKELARLQASTRVPAPAEGVLAAARQELSLAREARAAAAVRIRTAKTGLDAVELEYKSSNIRAPFGGVVLARHAQRGAYVKVGDPVVVLLDTASLEIAADVSASLLEALQPGTEVSGVRESGLPVRGRVRAVLPLEDPRTRTRSVRLEILDSQSLRDLAVGEAVTLSVTRGGSRRVLSVAKDALVREGGGWIVYVAKDGVAQPRVVLVGDFVGSRVEVRSGLEDGELAIVRGNERLQPGQSVTIGGESP